MKQENIVKRTFEKLILAAGLVAIVVSGPIQAEPGEEFLRAGWQ